MDGFPDNNDVSLSRKAAAANIARVMAVMRRVTKPATFHFESVSRASVGELVMAGLCFELFSAASAKSCPSMNVTTIIPWRGVMKNLASSILISNNFYVTYHEHKRISTGT
jgi:hypothetical protein